MGQKERLKELLTQADRGYDPAAHDELLAALGANPGKDLPLVDRFKAAAYLQRAICYLAKINNYYRPAEDYFEETVIDEDKLPGEMDSLMKLSRSFSYSPNVTIWLDEALRQFLEKFMDPASPLRQRGHEWRNMDESARLSFLHDFLREAVTFQSFFDAAYIQRITITPDKGLQELSAVTRTDIVKGEDGEKSAVCDVGISDRILTSNNLTPILAVLYHESIHILLTDLALAECNGKIDRDHPLFEDSVLRLAHMKYGYEPRSEIRSFYEADYEEQLAYRAQHQFRDGVLKYLEARGAPATPPAPP